mmetsp:Transcript_28420/g.64448  ORF Transcript_28420/g.64448 Transcript_28420/m.64448 type:complete len:165 (+) Transcript_28420:604-1098(+)
MTTDLPEPKKFVRRSKRAQLPKKLFVDTTCGKRTLDTPENPKSARAVVICHDAHKHRSSYHGFQRASSTSIRRTSSLSNIAMKVRPGHFFKRTESLTRLRSANSSIRSVQRSQQSSYVPDEWSKLFEGLQYTVLDTEEVQAVEHGATNLPCAVDDLSDMLQSTI